MGPRLQLVSPRLACCADLLAALWPVPGPALSRWSRGWVQPCRSARLQVHANDLNPECHHWLNHNVALNKVHRSVTTANCDAAAFLCAMSARTSSQQVLPPTRVVCNLPDSPSRMLAALCALNGADWLRRAHVGVHVYAFCKSESKLRSEVAAVLGGIASVELRPVRDVAPNKTMVCIEFGMGRGAG